MNWFWQSSCSFSNVKVDNEVTLNTWSPERSWFYKIFVQKFSLSNAEILLYKISFWYTLILGRKKKETTKRRPRRRRKSRRGRRNRPPVRVKDSLILPSTLLMKTCACWFYWHNRIYLHCMSIRACVRLYFGLSLWLRGQVVHILLACCDFWTFNTLQINIAKWLNIYHIRMYTVELAYLYAWAQEFVMQYNICKTFIVHFLWHVVDFKH